MLQIFHLGSPLEKASLLREFDPQTTTWLVSELRSKFEIQRQILKRQPYFEDTSVLRASELWRSIFRRAKPDWKVISKDFFQSWLKDELKKMNLHLSTNADVVLLRFMDHLSPILTHPEGPDRLRDWLLENPESAQRWGSWFAMSERIYSRLQELQVLPASWLAGSLQGLLKISDYWQRSIIVDLSSQLSRSEADLFLQLARDVDISILEPSPVWRDDFQFLLSGYDILRQQGPKPKVLAAASNPTQAANSGCELHCLTGILAEVKLCTEKIRQWLEQGHEASRLAVIAPEIEEYWPLLESYFQEEGIPVAKDRVTRLQTLPSVAKWLAQLRIFSGKVQFADLELSYYEQNEADRIRFEKFYALFSQLISAEDLARHQAIQQAYAAKFALNDELSRDEFIGFALRFWPENGESSWLEVLLRDLLHSSLDTVRLCLGSWLFYLEQLCAKREVRLQPGVSDGVQFLNLNSTESLHFSHFFYLGLSESQLKEKYLGLLKAGEVLRIVQDLGFYLDHPEMSSKEFDLAWAYENKQPTVVYSFAASNLKGGIESASNFWMKRSQGRKLLATLPTATRWNSIEQSDLLTTLPSVRNLSPQFLSLQKTFLDRDSGQVSSGKILNRESLQGELKLSISGIEDYLKCPFIFAAKRIFKLKDEATVDLEADGRSLGILEHALLEALCSEPRKFDWTESQIESILEIIRKEKEINFFDANVWLSLRQKYTKRAVRFLEFESEWKKLYPATHVLAREQEVAFFVEPESGEINRAKGIRFSGKIDRVDSNGDQQLVVIDYKSSTSSLKALKSWIENNQLQLLFYSLALDSQVVDKFTAAEVVGAFYYDLKKRDRNKGIRLKTADGKLFSLEGGGRNLVTDEQKQELYQQLKQKIAAVIQAILGGSFPAEPKDKKNCADCEWRNLCRAPHLK